MEERYALEMMEKTEREIIESVCALLQGHEKGIQYWVAYFVASLCGVDFKKMLCGCNTIKIVQARWLFWYAYRYMTNDTYAKIAETTSLYYGKKFSLAGVAVGINKISLMIESEPMWKKRWIIVKRIIKTYQDNDFTRENEDKTVTLMVIPPKGINIKLKTE